MNNSETYKVEIGRIKVTHIASGKELVLTLGEIIGGGTPLDRQFTECLNDLIEEHLPFDPRGLCYKTKGFFPATCEGAVLH